MIWEKTIERCELYRKRILFSGLCRFCSEVFFTTTNGQSHCNLTCRNGTLEKGFFRECFNCTKKIWKQPSRERKFCSRICYSKKYRGKESPNWKGGHISKISGYKMLQINCKPTREHRFIMEQYLKRKLKQFESVHHKNGLKTDNKIENLELWTKLQQPNGQRVSDLIKFVCKNYPEEIYAHLKITHATADALLLAEYAKRISERGVDELPVP